MRDAAVVPYFMVLNHKTGEWTADCKFCDFTSRRCNYPINAGAEVISHAKKPVSEGGGGHYDELSGLYYSAEGMQRDLQGNLPRLRQEPERDRVRLPRGNGG